MDCPSSLPLPLPLPLTSPPTLLEYKELRAIEHSRQSVKQCSDRAKKRSTGTCRCDYCIPITQRNRRVPTNLLLEAFDEVEKGYEEPGEWEDAKESGVRSTAFFIVGLEDFPVKKGRVRKSAAAGFEVVPLLDSVVVLDETDDHEEFEEEWEHIERVGKFKTGKQSYAAVCR